LKTFQISRGRRIRKVANNLTKLDKQNHENRKKGLGVPAGCSRHACVETAAGGHTKPTITKTMSSHAAHMQAESGTIKQKKD
jgi:hypothetical protein